VTPNMRGLLCAALGLACLSGEAVAQVKRVGSPSSPILQAAVVPAGTEIVYVSGITPPALNADAASGTPPVFGDTKTQTVGVLTRIADILKAEGLTLGDVFMMRVLLVGDPAKGGRMDFTGMMEGYTQFFANPKQPNKTARITSQVAGLVQPGMMVEIEVQAARPPR
jgi:enamine deaminase RidA (YjgF/YER057c/UK114 family)